jgi:hypothetical protein
MRTIRLCLWFSTVIISLFAVITQAAVVVTHPYQGITYISRTETSPRAINMHIVLVNLGDPNISFKLTPPGGTHDTVRQTTLDYLNQEHAQVAINCHFFLPVSSETNVYLTGLAASQGTIYSPFEPQPTVAGQPDQSYAILPYAPAINIDANNYAGIVHHNPSYSDNKHVVNPVKLWNAVSGSAQIVTNRVKSIPKYSGPPPVLNPISGYSDSNSWYSLTNKARTVIGLTQDNKTLVLFTVDAAGGSIGMAVGEVADLLISDYDVYNALNLDGGGSTTLAMEDPPTHVGQIMNVPADNPLGRAVGSNLAVFAADRLAEE